MNDMTPPEANETVRSSFALLKPRQSRRRRTLTHALVAAILVVAILAVVAAVADVAHARDASDLIGGSTDPLILFAAAVFAASASGVALVHTLVRAPCPRRRRDH